MKTSRAHHHRQITQRGTHRGSTWIASLLIVAAAALSVAAIAIDQRTGGALSTNVVEWMLPRME